MKKNQTLPYKNDEISENNVILWKVERGGVAAQTVKDGSVAEMAGE